MAYYDEQEDEEGSVNDPAAGAVSTGPGTATLTTGQTGQTSNQATAPAGAPDKGGNFVNLQTYLNANKPQAQKLGEQTAGILSNSVNQARGDVGTLGQKFNQAVDQNTVTKDNDALGMVGTTPEALQAQQREQLKKQYNAQYKGPMGLADLGDDYTKTLQSANKATQNIAGADTEEGRASLISQVNEKPRTQGITTFDNLLLQKGPGRDKLSGIVEQNKDVKDLIGNAQTAAQSKVGRLDDPNTPENEAAGALGTTAQTKADTYGAVQDALNAWKGGFDQKLTQARDTGTQQRVAKDLGGGDNFYDQETLQMFGLNPEDSIYRRNLNDYMNPFSPGDITAANVASQEDYAKYGALADIAGLQDLVLDQNNIGQAGTAKPFSVDSDRLKNDLTSDAASYQNALMNDRSIWAPHNNAGGGAPWANATINELKNQFLPDLTDPNQPWMGAYWSDIINRMNTVTSDFDKKYGANNKVKTASQAFNPTNSIKG